MPLTFGLSTPRDLLDKAERDLSELETAAVTQDQTMIADALYNFAVTAYHVKDWLKSTPSSTYSPTDVEDFVRASAALSVCRDLCNAGKHLRLRYEPTTETVEASVNALPAEDVPLGWLNTPIYRVKIVHKDGSRHEAVSLALQALADWQRFFQQHNL